eukprot:g26480.t1
MVDAWSGPVKYKVRVGEVVLNKHVDHMKAATSQMRQEQNIPSPSKHLAKLSEFMGFPPPPSIEETSKDEMNTADVTASMLLLPEDEFQLRCSRCKSRAVV